MSEEQIQALERFDADYRERHIEVVATGELVAVDIFFPGTLKSVGKVYIQTVPDCFGRFRLVPALHLEDAGDRRSDPEHPRVALLREASLEGPEDPEL
ncbi:MAG: hypothetical protein F4Y07_05090 [Gemmatimonadetes bacterium]|nr:hypothetical protein [Gemmatimonadota bacterium]